MSTRTAKAGTFSRLMLTVAAGSAIALSMIWLAGPVLATTTVTEITKNASCAELGDFGHEFKVEPVESGTFDDPNSDFSVDITVNDTPDGQTVDFDANIAVDAVFVKGGDGGNLYEYDPAQTSDTGLHAPLGPNDKWAGLSHISFCFTETPEESAEQSVAASASGEQSEKAGEGTPEGSQGDTSAIFNGSGPLATIAFSLILLASLGTLAYANVKSVRSRNQ